MKNYTVLLFDADETLLDFKLAEKEAFAQTLSNFGVEYSDNLMVLYSTSNKESWLAFEKGEITKAELVIRRFRLFFERAGLSFDPVEWNEYYKYALSQNGHLLEGAKEVIILARKWFKICIITNGIASVQYGRLKQAGIDLLFDHIFVSEEVGVPKPDKEYFDHVLSKLQVNKKECLIIGDSLSSDILGGYNYGIDTCHISWGKTKSDMPTYTVKNLDQLKEFLLTLIDNNR